jgi:hypothetical protein
MRDDGPTTKPRGALRRAVTAGTAVLALAAGTMAAAATANAANAATRPGAGRDGVREAVRTVTLTVHPDATVSANASDWTQVDSGYPSTSFWNETGDLEVGYCGFADCNGVGVARSFVTIPLPSQLSGATIDSADLYMTDEWAPSCAATNAQLWTTGAVDSSTDWNNQPAWDSELQEQAFAFGYSASCAYYTHDVTWSGSALTAAIQKDATDGKANQTFGLRAASETNDEQWKQFLSGSSNITLTVTYQDSAAGR